MLAYPTEPLPLQQSSLERLKQDLESQLFNSTEAAPAELFELDIFQVTAGTGTGCVTDPCCDQG